jgi:hypothetical protein
MSLSVLMPVHNDERFLSEAIASVVAQTLPDFELIVVLDRPSDASSSVAHSWRARDARVRVIDNAGSGLVDALNTGAHVAAGELIARLDADDRMRPDRLASQQAFLSRHGDIVAVGSQAIVIDAASHPAGRIDVPTGDAAIRARLMRGNPFVHSSMTFQRAAWLAAGRYRDDHPLAEDYDLWMRFAQVGRLANIAEPLVDYRRHAASLSLQSPVGQRLSRQLCLLDWKRDAGVLDAATAGRLRRDLVALFARYEELTDHPGALEGEDLDLFRRTLPYLSGDEARRLDALVARARQGGRLGAAAALAFHWRAAVTSRIAFARHCRSAVEALRIRASDDLV